jgi:phenylpropionate dioxygenase-like ring-hydroxylating dioxygenase large terminal subunit
MKPHDRAEGELPAFPTQAWYVVATSDEVTAGPLPRRALDVPLVLYRTGDGAAVVLEDRDAHRPYPLSLGRVDNDLIVSSYSGFAYARDGRCVRVPTQAEVPYGARVRTFPVREQDGLVWVWFAEPGLSELRQPPGAPWLVDPEWSTLGSAWTTDANYLLLHENFADITHVAVVDPGIAPPVLAAGPVPLLEVEVTETSVAFSRDYPPARLSPWHAPLVGAGPDDLFAQREQGRFVSPGLWVDSWDVHTGDVRRDSGTRTFRFTHAVTPVDASSTRHVWRISRNFAPGADVSANLTPLFTDYYDRVRQILETMQRVIARDGVRDDVSVAADAAALQVRKIVTRMLAEERQA